MNNKYAISESAKILGISIDTLRRLDKKGLLKSIRESKAGHRYYMENDLINYIKKIDIFDLVNKWIKSKIGFEPIPDYYCRDSYILQSRLVKLENELHRTETLKEIYPLIVAVAGEIGNNSFDHNLGNWPDIPGIFFAWDIEKRKIVLADRGRGVLATLKSVKPELKNDQEALFTAFTEIITGRAPENRGNGLKFVKDVVQNNDIKLFFQSGNAELSIKKNKKNLNIKIAKQSVRGCLALIEF